jgi:hypothetical protein
VGRPSEVERLLDDLYSRLGFCLRGEHGKRLTHEPPTDADAFTDAVFQAEGLDPSSSSNRRLREQVHTLIIKHLDGQNWG